MTPQFVNGKTGLNRKVKEVPTAVTVLGPDNFDSIVMDPKKDVLVEFYAPWCGHCKQLAPKYEKVAATFKGEPNVRVTGRRCSRPPSSDGAGLLWRINGLRPCGAVTRLSSPTSTLMRRRIWLPSTVLRVSQLSRCVRRRIDCTSSSPTTVVVLSRRAAAVGCRVDVVGGGCRMDI